MRRLFTLLGLMLVAIFAMGAVASTAAFAEEAQTTPLNLPFTAKEELKGESEGSTEFKSSAGTVVCKKATALESNVESNLPPLGLFHIHFKECSSAGQTCTGLGEEAGVILVLGKWHLVWDEEGTTFELHTATLFLVETVHFNCTALVLIEVKGEQLCLDLKPEESNVLHSFHCIAEGTKQKDSWCAKDVEAKCSGLTNPLLLSSTNHAPFKEAAELALGNFVATEAVAAMKL